jgi:hypothetical protein
MSRSYERGWHHVTEAERSAALTGDDGLQDRVSAVKDRLSIALGRGETADDGH